MNSPRCLASVMSCHGLQPWPQVIGERVHGGLFFIVRRLFNPYQRSQLSPVLIRTPSWPRHPFHLRRRLSSRWGEREPTTPFSWGMVTPIRDGVKDGGAGRFPQATANRGVEGDG
jgi:hypothetical protein